MRGAAVVPTYHNPLKTVGGAVFDGTNDYMTRGATLTGASDSKTGILSLWFKVNGGNATSRLMLSSWNGSSLQFQLVHGQSGDDKISVFGINSSFSTILNLKTNTAYSSGSTWRHILASWNLATGGARSLYVNDVNDLNEVTFTNDTLDYTATDWSIGAAPNGNFKGSYDLTELYFAPGQYLDFSLISNRRKFISASGKPVHLGSTGSLPTGTAPLVYLPLNANLGNAEVNSGTGGNFTITGILTATSTNPSD